jgi:hypothetical protein
MCWIATEIPAAVDAGEIATKIPFTAAADVFGIAAEVPAAAEIMFLY